MKSRTTPVGSADVRGARKVPRLRGPHNDKGGETQESRHVPSPAFSLHHVSKIRTPLECGGLLLLGSDRLLGAFARPGVRLRALAANRQAATVAQAAIAADVGQPLDMARDLTPQVAFHLDLAVDGFAQLLLFVFAEILDARVRIDARALQDLMRRRKPDAVDVGKCDLDALLARKIDAGDASHNLSLYLLVLGVDLADDADLTLATDDDAFFANALDGRTNFHDVYLRCVMRMRN